MFGVTQIMTENYMYMTKPSGLMFSQEVICTVNAIYRAAAPWATSQAQYTYLVGTIQT